MTYSLPAIRLWFKYLLWSTGFLLVFQSCNVDPADSPKSREEVFRTLDQSFEQLKQDSTGVVDFRILKDALPDQLLGMKRATHEGQKTGLGGFSVSSAEATYSEGDQQVKITILDTGGLGSLLSQMASWAQLEMDHEDDDGYERTTMVDGRKVYEKYSTSPRQGTVAMIAADRFLVTISGEQVEASDLVKALSKIRIKH